MNSDIYHFYFAENIGWFFAKEVNKLNYWFSSASKSDFTDKKNDVWEMNDCNNIDCYFVGEVKL